MKSIQEIERLRTEELEQIGNDTSVNVPSGLKDRLADMITAKAAMESGCQGMKPAQGKRIVRIGATAVSAAAACMALFFTIRQQPEDTFSDPRLAYAELERTFSYISSKVDKGLAIASEAEPVIGRTSSIISGIRPAPYKQ